MAAESGPYSSMLQSLMLFKERPDTINSTGIELSKNGSGRDRHEGMQRSLEQEQEEIFSRCTRSTIRNHRDDRSPSIGRQLRVIPRAEHVHVEHGLERADTLVLGVGHAYGPISAKW